MAQSNFFLMKLAQILLKNGFKFYVFYKSRENDLEISKTRQKVKYHSYIIIGRIIKKKRTHSLSLSIYIYIDPIYI